MAAFPATVTVACPECSADVAVPLTLRSGRPAGRPESARLVVRIEAGPVSHTCSTPARGMDA